MTKYILTTRVFAPRTGRTFCRTKRFSDEIEAQVAATGYALRRGIPIEPNNWGYATGCMGPCLYEIVLRRYERTDDGAVTVSQVELRPIIEVKSSNVTAL